MENPHDTTIRQALRETLLLSGRPSHAVTYRQALRFGYDYPDFDDYMIRTTALQSPDRFEKILQMLDDPKAELKQTTPLYIGGKVSQSLLQLAKGDDTFMLEIVPKHKGITLAEEIPQDMPPLAKKRTVKFMQHFLDHPEQLRAIYQESAFIGLQPDAPASPDHHMGNLMVDEDEHGLSVTLIDMVPSEDVATLVNQTKREVEYRETPEEFAWADVNQAAAIRYLCEEGTNSLRMLFEQKIPGLANHNEPSEAFIALSRQIEEETITKIKDGTLAKDHPTWKGFSEVTDVQAIPLTQKMHTLKLELDKLYARAVPEHSAQR